MDIAGLARKYALKNAHDYGHARVEPIIGRLLSTAKGSEVATVKAAAADAVAWANTLGKKELDEKYAEFAGEFEEERVKKADSTARPKLELGGAEVGKVATRLSPEPSGYMQIGNVKQALLSEQAAKMYKGKFYRFFDDTNPEKSRQMYVDAMKRDHEWLGLEFDDEYYASDYVEDMYSYAERLINAGMAYVCRCGREEMQKKRFDGQECGHREQAKEENARLFKDMLGGKFRQGDATVRFMGDMKSNNTVLRDPVLLRIVEKPHYRQGDKYRVWPVYDFSTPILDSVKGVTDIIRSKEYELRDALGMQILEALGLRVPRIHNMARLNIKGNTTHKREIRTLIEEGKIMGWDDPRLMTIAALRRRGIVPEAIKEFVMRFGYSKTDGEVPLDMLLAENRSIIDRFAKHLFFVRDPVRINVDRWGLRKSELRAHPVADLGSRAYDTTGEFYISKGDADSIKVGDAIRLKDLGDVKITSMSEAGIGATAGDGDGKGRIVQWVPAGNAIECTVLMPRDILDTDGNFNPDSMETAKGLVEGSASALVQGEPVQFERFGYCILDRKDDMRFIFTSE